jgi:hypothetical protein
MVEVMYRCRMKHGLVWMLQGKFGTTFTIQPNPLSLVGYKNNGSGSSSIPSKPGSKFGPFQKTENLHEISALDFIQAYSRELEDHATHEQRDNFDLPDKFEVDNNLPESSDTQLVNAATC